MANYNAPIVEGQVLNIPYTGTIQSIEIKKPGLYKLEAWGGQGYMGQKAGYSVGYKEFKKKGQIIYVCVGGKGGYINSSGGATYYNGRGFNGGGDITVYREWCSQGGGATHFAFVNGLLQNIGYANRGNILIVAGGSGAGVGGSSFLMYGGTGGGLSGGNGTYSTSQHGGASGRGYPGAGGTQTSGGLGYAENGGTGALFNGKFGKGGSTSNAEAVCTGGGGFWGGGAGADGYYDDPGSSGGGSGYIDGAPSITYKGIRYTSSTQNNIWGVYPFDYSKYGYYGEPPGYNGKAAITFIKKGTPTLYYGDKEVDALFYGDREVDALFYGDREIG